MTIIKKFKGNMARQNYLDVKTIIAFARKKLKAKQIDHFQNFCHSINQNISKKV